MKYKMTFFEGAEKRLSVLCSSFGQDEVEDILRKTGCNVLGKLQNDDAMLFLLSESACYVKNNVITLKTCGNLESHKLLDHVDFESFHFVKTKMYEPSLQPKTYQK